MRLQNRSLVTEKVIGEADAGRDSVIGVNISGNTFNLAPVQAESEAGIDVKSLGHLPGVLGEGFQSGIASVEIVSIVLVGQVWIPIIIIILNMVAQLSALTGEP